MGNPLAKLFSGLTQEGIMLPDGSFQSGSQAENSVPDPSAMMGETGMSDSPKSTDSSLQKLPFLQAMKSGPGGMPNALSPALTTKGKLLTALLAGVQGGLAGTGQRTVGQGFQAGMQVPVQQAQNRIGIQRGELENQTMAASLPFLRAQKMAELNKTQAQTNQATAETAAIPAKTGLEQAQREAAYYKDDPNLGLIDIRTGQPVNSGGMAPLSPEEAQVLGKQPGEHVPLKLKNTANEIVNRGFATVNTEEGVYERNRGTGTMTRLGSNPRMMFAPGEQYTPVAADPNNPANITLMKKGQAAQQGVSLPQSAETQVAKKAAASEVPTKIGDQKVAFTTAIAHADLLRKAARALDNSDQQTLNGLKNAFSNEFGATGPITAQVIADAYTREATSMLSKGHLTNSEIDSVGKTINPNKQNYAQIDSVLGAYQALAQSKMNNLDKQKDNAINLAKPNGKANAQRRVIDFTK